MICVGGPFAGCRFAQDRSRLILELFEPPPMRVGKAVPDKAARVTTKYTKRVLKIDGVNTAFWALEDMSTEEALNTVFVVYANTLRIATRTRGGERGGNDISI